jgi:hypothetical protein
MIQEWDILAENMEVLHSEMGGTGAKDGAFKEELVDTFTSIEEKINKTDSQMKLLISEIGVDNIASEKGSNSVWMTIGGIQGELSRIDIQVTLMHETMVIAGDDKQRIIDLEMDRDLMKKRLRSLDGHETDVNGKLRMLDSNHNDLYKHHKHSMTEISDVIRKINGRVKHGVLFGGVTGEGVVTSVD